MAIRSIFTGRSYTPTTATAVPPAVPPPVAPPAAAPALDLGLTTIILYVAGDIDITNRIDNLVIQRR